MRIALFGPAVAAAGLLSACAVAPPGANPPTSMQSQGTILINHGPESANSLPPGASVLAPLTGVAGQLNTVAVGPPALPRAVPPQYY